ncbi:MAG: nitroreductase family protein [Candidatus Micrarchaeia archaeon]|jgi:nitroreductase
MEALEAIMTRKSVREFGYRPMPDDALERILAAGMQAPSARNGQPWHFVVVAQREALMRIPEFSPYTKMVSEASAGILVCGDTKNTRSGEYFVQDCAAATENILLAAHALGMGGVWTGIYPDRKKMEGFRKLLGIPAHIAPVAFAVIGFPKKIEAAEPRYDKARVHREKW